MGCKFERTEKFDTMKSFVGDIKAYQILSENKGVPDLGYKLNGEKDSNHDFLIYKFGFEEGTRMWYNTFLNEMNSKELQSDSLGVFFEEDGESKYYTPKMVDKYGWEETQSAKNPAISALSKSVGEYRGRLAVQKLIDKMSKITGNHVIKETEITAAKQDKKGWKGWVDSNGIHINTDTVTPDTFVHELSHVWLYWLRNTNPDAYVRIMDLTREHMQYNPSIVKAIQSSYNTTDDAFVEEYFSTVSGIMSMEDVLSTLNKELDADEAVEASSNVFKTVRNYINKAYEDINKMLRPVTPGMSKLDMSSATFKDIIDAIKADFILGVSPYTNEEVSTLWSLINNDTRLMEFPYPSLNIDMSQGVLKTIDFIPILSGTSINDRGITMSMMSNDQYADYIARALVPYDNNNQVYYYQGKQFLFSKSMTREDIKAKIINDILPEIGSYKTNLISDFDTMIRSYDPFDTDDTSLDEWITKYKLNKFKVMDMIVASGLAEGYSMILKYSELAKLDDKVDAKLKSLYHDDFVGVDPYIIVHEDVNGKKNISIFDISADKISNHNTENSGRNIFGQIALLDNEYPINGGSLNLDNGGMKMFLNGLIALYAVKNDFKINSISAFSTPNSNGERRTILNINELFANYDILANNDKLAALRDVVSPTIMNTIKAVDLKDTNNNVSQLGILKNYVINHGNTYAEHAPLYRMFMNTRVDKAEMKKVLSRRLRVIESQYPGKEQQMRENKEYQLLSLAYAEVTGMTVRALSTTTDISPLERKFASTHFVSTPFQQYIKERFDETSFLIIEDVKSAMNRTSEARKKVFKSSRSLAQADLSKEVGGITSYLWDSGSKLFDGVYKDVEVIDENGQKANIKLPFAIHYDVNDPDTKIALANNKVTKEEIEYGSQIMNEIKERSIRNIMHNASINGTDLKYEDAAVDYDKLMNSRQGNFSLSSAFIPVMQKTSTELFTTMFGKKKIKEMAGQLKEKLVEDFSNDSFVNVDVIHGGGKNVLDKMGNSYLTQMYNFNEVLATCGLAINEMGQLKVIDRGKLESITTNIELVFNSFMLASARKEHVETQFIPAYNVTKATMDIYSNLQSRGKLKEAEAWIDKFVEININRESNKAIGTMKSLHAIEGMITRFYGTAVLGYYFPLAGKSLFLNEQQFTLNSITNSITRRLDRNKDDASTVPGVEDYAKAHKLLMFGGREVMNKAYYLAHKYQLIDSSERDMLHNPINVISKRFASNQQNSQVANWITDNFARVAGMTAQMLKDGTWDAHDYNKKTGEATYNATKDTRYNSDKGKAILNYILKDNNQLGLDGAATIEDMTIAYNVSEVKKMKYFADVYIVGAMTDDVKPQIAYELFARLLIQMRLFSVVRLNRFGIGTSTHETTLGTGIKAYQDKNGEWVTEREQRVFESMIGTLKSATTTIAKFKKGNMNEWWNEASEERKGNLVRSAVTLAMWAVMFALVAAFKPEDEEESKYYKHIKSKYKWAWTDLIDFMVLSEIYRNPITSVSFLSDLYSVIFKGAPLYKGLRYLPFINTLNAYDLIVSQDEKDAIKKEMAKKKREEADAKKKAFDQEMRVKKAGNIE